MCLSVFGASEDLVSVRSLLSAMGCIFFGQTACDRICTSHKLPSNPSRLLCEFHSSGISAAQTQHEADLHQNFGNSEDLRGKIMLETYSWQMSSRCMLSSTGCQDPAHIHTFIPDRCCAIRVRGFIQLSEDPQHDR